MVKYVFGMIGAYGCAILIWIAGLSALIFIIVTILRALHVLPPG